MVIPTITLPWPSRTHRAMAAAMASHRDWAARVGLLTSDAVAGRFERLRAAELAARGFPDAPTDALELIAQWLAWIFLLDDEIDHTPARADPDQCTAVLDPVCRVVGSEAGPDTPLAVALRDLLERTLPRLSTSGGARLLDNIAGYLESQQRNTDHRHERQPAAVLAYLDERREAGVKNILDLAELSTGSEIPPAWFDSREHQDLYLSAVDLVCWVNDVVSLPKELPAGEVNSLPVVIAASAGCPLPAALEMTVAMIDARAAYFDAAAELAAVLADSVPAVSSGALRRTLECYRTFAGGHLDWCLSSPRYTSAAAEGG